MTIDEMATRYARAELDCVVIVAPAGVHEKWAWEEFPKHWPDSLMAEVAVMSSGMNKKAKAEVDGVIDGDGRDLGLRVLCTNYECVARTKEGRASVVRMLQSGAAMLVLDESQRIKGASSITTKVFHKIRTLAEYRRILTGTPIEANPFDAWAQFYFLDPSILGASFVAFRAEHGEYLRSDSPKVLGIAQKAGMLKRDEEGMVHFRAGYNAKRLPKILATDQNGAPIYRNLDSLREKIAAVSDRVLKVDCLDLPPKLYSRHFHHLTPSQRSIYDQLRRDRRLEAEDPRGPVWVVKQRLAVIDALMMVAAGHAPLGRLGKYRPLFSDPAKNPRIAALAELLEGRGQQQGLIWARHLAEIAEIATYFESRGISFGTYTGETAPPIRRTVREAFQAGRVQYFLGTAAAGGIGLDLYAAKFVVYYSNSFKYGERLQSEDRAHRIGQTGTSVDYFDIEAVDTVDARVRELLLQKRDVADIITGDEFTSWLS